MKQIEPAKVVPALVEFLKKTVSQAGFSNAVIGVSGGVDSATSCALAVQALGKEHVYPVLLPYGILSTQATLDGIGLVQDLHIPIQNILRVDIKPAVDAIAPALGSVDSPRRGNLMARMRMIVLFDQAKRRQALVVGTENKSEHLLGYYTRFGDEASDIEPLRNFYKTQVYEIAKFLSVSESILTKKPTAGLWDGQTDEGEFGFTYKDADEIMSLLYDEKKLQTDVVLAGFDKNIIEKVVSRVESNAFKQHLPIVPNSNSTLY